MIYTILALVVYFGFILTWTGSDPVLIIVLALVILLVASFATLNVVIDEKYLRIKFGYGIYRKRFVLKEITSVRTVKNRWYYGWGIRFWWNPRMWIYNVSGFDAVEIKMVNGKIYRIGTDEPVNLEQAIKQAVRL